MSSSAVSWRRYRKPTAIHLALLSAFTSYNTYAQEISPKVEQLSTVNVTADKLTDEEVRSTEGTGSYKASKTKSATGFTLSNKETPQSVTQITRQQIEDQGMTDIEDALTSTTGISVYKNDNGVRTYFRSRGFGITNYNVDGLSFYSDPSDFAAQGLSINMDLLDNVTVVRGANGLLGGTGDPSATIYLERKKPKKEFSADVALSYGSYGKKRAMADLSIPITKDGSVRSRFVVSDENSNTFRDREHIQNVGVLANFEADLTKNTTLGFGIEHTKNHHNGASWGANVPIWMADGSLANLPRSTNPVADWSYYETKQTTIFSSLTHRFDNNWNAHLAFSHTEGDATNNLGVAKANSGASGGKYGGYWNADGSGAILNANHQEAENQRNNIALDVNGPFQLLGRTHELLMGFNGYHQTATEYTFDSTNCNINDVTTWKNGQSCQYRATSGANLAIPDWRNWDGSYGGFNTYRTNARTLTTTDSYGGYIAGRFSITDPLHLIVGSRISNYKSYIDTYDKTNASQRSKPESFYRKITPYAGIIYDINKSYSAYASYTSIFNPQTNRDTDGNYLAPVEGKSYETGIKGEFFNGLVNGSISYFRNNQKNVAESIDGEYVKGTTNEQAYSSSGEGVKTHGFDVELAGSITPNWNIYGGYTNLIVKDPTTNYRADPHHLLRISTTYSIDKYTFGGGMNIQSATTSKSVVTPSQRPFTNNVTEYRNHGYALFNLMAKYQINNHMSRTLNIDNLFDKKYYTQYGFYDGLIWGDPRTITATLRYSM